MASKKNIIKKKGRSYARRKAILKKKGDFCPDNGLHRRDLKLQIYRKLLATLESF